MNITKKVSMIMMGMLLVGSSLLATSGNSVFAASDKNENEAVLSPLEQQGLILAIDEEGNASYQKVEAIDMHNELALPEKTDKDTKFELKRIMDDGEPITIQSYDSFEEANSAMTRQSKFRSVGTLAVFSDDQIRSVTNGVVNFNTKGNAVTYFTEDGTGERGYLNGAYGADGAYLGTNSDGTKVKFKMAGVTGWVNKEDVQILNYDNEAIVQSVNYYKVKDGYIYHCITTNVNKPYYQVNHNVGQRQSYMKEGEYYYSYDGHYFYHTYAQMISDYKNNTYANSINASTPYYNYYQFLSFRTKTSITAAQFNNVVNANASSSKMANEGANFVKYQDIYGANAALSFGVGANESAWGTSYYAQQRNNLFGLAAYDSNPDNASSFPSVGECIRQFMQTFVSINYTDPNDVSGLYHGACLGDKSVGFSIKYASAPYWGETNAHFAYATAIASGNTSDINKYTIAIKKDHSNINIRKEPSTSSTALYKTGTSSNYPFVVLGTVQGESVNGNTTWYKIATDAPLSADRSKALQFNVNQGGEYDTSVSYAYISATLVDIVSNGSSSGGGDPQPPTPSYKKGDVNGNGKIDAADYLMIMDSILGKFTMNDTQKKAADVNGNGKVDAADYLMIMDCILGKITIN